MTFENPDALRINLKTFFINRNDKLARLGMTIDTFQNIPGLVGFWPMSGVQRSTGDTRDFGMGSLDLAYNGSPIYKIYNGFMPYIDLDGTGDYLSRADETDLDILGTEAHNVGGSPGLTIGGWIQADRLTAFEGFITKLGDAPNRAFMLRKNGTDLANFRISSDGTNAFDVDSLALSISVWYFIVGRFTPSTELALWVNNVKTTNVVSIPASIFNSSADLNIGARNHTGVSHTDYFDGRISLCFLSANALSDAYINGLFQQSRVLFGV